MPPTAFRYTVGITMACVKYTDTQNGNESPRQWHCCSTRYGPLAIFGIETATLTLYKIRVLFSILIEIGNQHSSHEQIANNFGIYHIFAIQNKGKRQCAKQNINWNVANIQNQIHICMHTHTNSGIQDGPDRVRKFIV